MEPQKVIPKSTQWARANPERNREIARAHYQRNKEKCTAASKEYRASHMEEFHAWRGHYRLKKYGLTPVEYELLFDKSCGCCAICQKVFDALPHIDHCHETGEVRGLLCSQCNTGLGMFQDSTATLQAAMSYLTNSRKK